MQRHWDHAFDDNGVTKKECVECEEFLPLDAFGKAKNRWEAGRRQPRCKECTKRKRDARKNLDAILATQKRDKPTGPHISECEIESDSYAAAALDWLDFTYFCGDKVFDERSEKEVLRGVWHPADRGRAKVYRADHELTKIIEIARYHPGYDGVAQATEALERIWGFFQPSIVAAHGGPNSTTQMPKVKRHNRYEDARACWYWNVNHTISLARWGLTAETLCHEAAHGVASVQSQRGIQRAHGPAFVGALIAFLQIEVDMPCQLMLEVFAEQGVDVMLPNGKLFRKAK